jgi:hypothetical protein
MEAPALRGPIFSEMLREKPTEVLHNRMAKRPARFPGFKKRDKNVISDHLQPQAMKNINN